MKVRIIEPAEQDLLDGYLFYESQAEGVGQYFLDCLYSDIDSLVLFAGTHRKVFGEFHWLLSKRFPFAVYYTLEDKSPWCMRSSIAAKALSLLKNDWRRERSRLNSQRAALNLRLSSIL